jgi:membrane associated rhomboid family serine protease
MASIWDDFKGAFKTKNNELIQIIVINIVVFLVGAFLMVTLTLSGKGAVFQLISKKLAVTSNLHELIWQPWSVITYMFFHEMPFHILFNMLFLYWFGLLVEEYIGGSRVTNLYILGGVAGAVLYLLMYNLLPYFSNQVASSVMLGASGGVFAVVFGAATLLPDYSFRILLIGDVKIKYIAWFYLVLSFIDLSGGNAGGNAAHIGGSILGFAYVKLLQSGTDLGVGLQWFLNLFKNAFKPRPKKTLPRRVSFSEAVSKNKSASNSSTSNVNRSVGQDEIDMMLDKINKSGYESLTKDEKMKLFKASQQNEG